MGRCLLIALIVLTPPAKAITDTCGSWLCGPNGWRGQSAFEELAKFEYEESNRVLSNYRGLEPDIQERLVRYRQEIASKSYRETLRLCVAYRKFAGYGDAHESELNESLKSWSIVAVRGLHQPVDALIGLKSDYLEIAQIGVLDFSNFFRSMYVLNFLNSSGFLYGAAHCLNTVDSREIEKFARIILVVDYWSSGVTELVSGSVLSSLLSRPVAWWVLHPLKLALSKLELGRLRPALILSSGSLSILLADEFNCRMALRELNETNISDLVFSSRREEQEKRIQVVRSVANAYVRFQDSCRPASQKLNELDHCQSSLGDLVRVLKTTHFRRDLDMYKRDLKKATESETLGTIRNCGDSQKIVLDHSRSSDRSKTYLRILNRLIPLIERFEFQSN
jgi:hypothetical protein